MYVVVFRAIINQQDEAYQTMAQRMRDLAFAEFSCVDLSVVTENGEEIAVSYWNSLDDIKAWKQHSEHLVAQELGREQWLKSYRVDIAEVVRSYSNLKSNS